jgi:hypothetical protein
MWTSKFSCLKLFSKKNHLVCGFFALFFVGFQIPLCGCLEKIAKALGESGLKVG